MNSDQGQLYKDSNSDGHAALHTESLRNATTFLTRVAGDSSKRAIDEVGRILDRHDQMMLLQITPGFQFITQLIKRRIGEAVIGTIFCIDGRIPNILFQPYKTWEVPGGRISSYTRMDSGSRVPRAKRLTSGVERAARRHTPLVQFSLGHYDRYKSASDCAAFTSWSVEDPKLMPDGQRAEVALARHLAETSAVCVNNLYQTWNPGIQVVVENALYDTATAGLDFKDLQSGELLFSTAEYCLKIRQGLAESTRDEIPPFGYFGEIVQVDAGQQRGIDINVYLEFSRAIVDLTDIILGFEPGSDELRKMHDFSGELIHFVNRQYGDFSEEQKKAIKYVLARTIAYQYLTGYAASDADVLHPYRSHNEQYLALSTDGMTVGYQDLEQAFVSSAADIDTALGHLWLKLGLIRKLGRRRDSFVPFFVSTLIAEEDYNFKNQNYDNARNVLLEQVRRIAEHENLGEAVKSGELIVVPVYLHRSTGVVLGLDGFFGSLA